MTTLLDISKLAVLYLRQSTLGQLRDNVVVDVAQGKDPEHDHSGSDAREQHAEP